LRDLSKEYYAVLLGKYERFGKYQQINVYDLRFLDHSDYKDQGTAFLRLKKEFIHKILIELTNRYDVDSILDVHTHPFSTTQVGFSPIDDRDEIDFFHFLDEKFEGLHYGSIVLSQTEYSARIWDLKRGETCPKYTIIKTQTKQESINSSDFPQEPISSHATEFEAIFNRSALAFGLDVLRKLLFGQVISIVGIGGIGSIIAEHLIHMGFHNVNLIDHDTLEISNLNRIVGASYDDAVNKALKVDVAKLHLEKINPRAKVAALANDVHDEKIQEVIALSDWIIVATDNHSSRFRVQQLCVKYFIPMISVGVNITAQNGEIRDMSGEVITSRIGDNLCLNCLGRINPTKVANETHPDEAIKEELVKRGYVTGMHVKEPAVKTLNTVLATIAVDILVNQYTERQRHTPILVYEDNINKVIYEDVESVGLRNKNCFTCNI
jgi:molybdopterin/thiamine biosynthesis adenylyltransferase